VRACCLALLHLLSDSGGAQAFFEAAGERAEVVTVLELAYERDRVPGELAELHPCQALAFRAKRKPGSTAAGIRAGARMTMQRQGGEERGRAELGAGSVTRTRGECKGASSENPRMVRVGLAGIGEQFGSGGTIGSTRKHAYDCHLPGAQARCCKPCEPPAGGR
jgi:hypothetical protein